MKKYFAKLLPIEGKIIAGDVAIAPSYGEGKVRTTHIAAGTTIEQVIFEDNYTHPAKYCQRVKLFLCSTEIKEDDILTLDYQTSQDFSQKEVWFKGSRIYKGIQLYDVYQDWKYSGRRQTNVVRFDQAFKVIGEISPNAIWVTEGMEFDEGDITHYYKIEDIEWEDLPSLPEGYLFRIKCPTCKTFH